MIISEERQIHLAHIIVNAIWDDDLVDFTNDEVALRLAKQAVAEFVKEDEQIDEPEDKKLQLSRR